MWYWNNCLLKINISNHFIGKRPNKLVFDSFFFHHFSPQPHTNLDQTLAQISPPWPWVILYQFVFTMLGSLLKSIHIFGMKCQTRLLEQEEPISRLPVENYVVFVVVGYWARGRILGNIGTLQKYWFHDGYERKKTSFFSPYYRLERFSTGPISELLWLRKESDSSFNQKWPDTGKHTVLGTFNRGVFIILFLLDRGRIWEPSRHILNWGSE